MVLIAYILVKLNLSHISYRLVLKPLLTFILIIYYTLNVKKRSMVKYKTMLTALSMFLIGDFIFVFQGVFFFGLGMLFFLLGKIFYTFSFSNNENFSIKKIIPFLSLCFVYMVFILSLVYEHLGGFLIPILVYVFVALITFLFAYLRSGSVNRFSYVLVLIGVVFSVFSDTIGLIQVFYEKDIPFKEFLLVLIYGISQYFIVLGITHEDRLRVK